MKSYSYHPICRHCQGEGTIEVEVASYSGLGGFIMQTQGCKACNATGTDFSRTITFEDDDLDPEPATAPVVFLGGIVDAPAFTTATFAAGVAKAQRLGTVHMEPGIAGTVLVTSPTSGARYAVRRQDCSCKAGQTHGYCWHRAAVLYVHDVCGIQVSRERILGFDPAGDPVTAADRAAQLLEEARGVEPFRMTVADAMQRALRHGKVA